VRVPASFDAAFQREEKTAKRLRELAGARLRRLCNRNDWLFAQRIKASDSALDKMQLGLVPALDQMYDTYAATIVVPTRSEISKVVTTLRADLRDAHTRKTRRGDPAVFAYDDVHVLASLRHVAPGGIPAAIRNRRFEIQVRTGLQYAWWRATHDEIYKGSSKNWRLERAASQLRGTLEMVDGLLADLPAAAEMLDRLPTDLDPAFERVASWLDGWPTDRRPADRIRFHETVSELLEAGGISLAGAEALLNGREGRELVANEAITPAQAITILVVQTRGLSPLWRRAKRRWIMVTSEMESVCPSLRSVPAGDRARF